MSDEMPELIRWLSWGKDKVISVCDKLHFERGTKQRYGLGPVDDTVLKEGIAEFDRAGRMLDRVLAEREWLVGTSLSCADFRMAAVLPYRYVVGSGLGLFPQIAAWHVRLCMIAA